MPGCDLCLSAFAALRTVHQAGIMPFTGLRLNMRTLLGQGSVLKLCALQVWFEVSPHTGRLHFHLAPDGSCPLGFSTPMDECMHSPVSPQAASASERLPEGNCAHDELAGRILRAAITRYVGLPVPSSWWRK